MKYARTILAGSIILCLLLSGCGSDTSQNTFEQSVPETQNVEPEEAALSVAETPPASDPYPTPDEIRAVIDAGESRLYWLASPPELHASVAVYAVNTPDMDDFGADFSEIVGPDCALSEAESASSITVTAGDPETATAKALDALSRITGISYVAVEAEDEWSDFKYAPELDGYCVDSIGYPYGDGEWSPGTYLGVAENGQMTVSNPLILEAESKSVQSASLISPETVQTICTAYFENYGLPTVVVVENISLVYYYSDQQLLPAWKCELTRFMSENGHPDSIMLDAQTGELLRK